MKISAIIPTHNPRVDLLREVVASVAAQSTPADTWELLIVDNASNPALRTLIDFPGLNSTKILEESALGLTYARLKGIRESRGDYIVFIDDDTILDSTYFQHVVEFFEEHPAVSIIGGAITARLDCEPPPWFQEFSSNLALRDLGRDIQIFQASYDSHQRLLYPLAAPVGAGMALRKTTAESYAHSLTESTSFLSDRKGTDLSSAGDCEIVIGALSSGKAVAYVPKLKLTHVIPSHRLRFSYFARLRYSIGRSWVHLLYQYAASPWPPLDRAALPLSLGRSFFRMKAWSCKTRFVEWAYFAGQLRGRADYAHYTRLSKICAHVTMGKLLYRTYYQPLHSVKRIIAQGIARSFEQLKNESEMKQKVHTLRSVQPCPEPGLPVHFLSGSKFWEQTCLCFASLAKVSPITLHPIIIDDGTLRRSHRKSIKTVLPQAVIIEHWEIDARLDRYLPQREFPFLRARRLEYPHLRKLTDIHVGTVGWKLVLDSDMIFYRTPTELLDWLQNPLSACHMVDTENAYGYSSTLMESLCGHRIPEKVNVGITGLDSGTLPWQQLEDWIRIMLEKEGSHYYQEQALIAMLMASTSPKAFPADRYICKPSTTQVDTQTGIMHHYVAESRFDYFRTAWRNIIP